MKSLTQRYPSNLRTRALLSLGAAGLLSLAVGCSNSSQPVVTEAQLAAEESPTLDHTHPELVVLDGVKAVEAAFDGDRANFVQEKPFRQVGFFYRSENGNGGLDWRVRYTSGKWSDWAPVEVTWEEEDLHVGRVLLDQEALEIELRDSAGLQSAHIEFYEEVVANTTQLTRDLPFAKASDDGEAIDLSAGVKPLPSDNDGDFRTVGQAVAPSSLVVPRSGWGARNTNCSGSHSPNRMSIHHTYAPATDGGDAARAMRGMQAYHIDTNGWCDIGYHFVVSQSAKIFQGRSRSTEIGAHVGGQNTGNVGICLIGNFQPGYSNTQTPSESQLAATGRIVGWVSETHSIALNRTKVLGHRENPGQSTTCPGTNLLNKIPHILDLAGGGSKEEYNITVKVKWNGTQNFYTQGISHNIADALPGDQFKAEILIKNDSSGVVRNVSSGFEVLQPYLKATNYSIYSDHPAYDQSSWTLNDANDEPNNPPNSNLGASGKLNLNAFSPGETKRILIDMEATQYSITDSPSGVVRAWIQHAESTSTTIYGEQTSWGGSVATNEFGQIARGYARVDVLERDTWLFDDTEDDANLEGWTGAPEAGITSLKVNTSLGAMALKHADANVELTAPDWTEINADQYDQLVLRLRSHDGPHTAVVYWGTGDGFDPARSVAFRGLGDSEFNDLVIPMSSHSDWAGTIKELKIVPLLGDAPAEDASAWYDIDAIFFQSSTEKATSAPGIEYSEETPVELVDPGADSEDPSDDEKDPGVGGENPGQDGGDPGNDGESPLDEDGNPRVKVKSGGCSSTGADADAAPLSPSGVAWALGLGALGLLSRRRRG